MRLALGAAVTLAAAAGLAPRASAQVGPYFMLVVDNSGSITASTGGGLNSCGQTRNRMTDAKCVLTHVVDGCGGATFGLTRFRRSCCGSCSSPCLATCGCSCSTCEEAASSGEVLVPIAAGNTSAVLEWADYTCASCGVGAGAQPELTANGLTPNAGRLRAARECSCNVTSLTAGLVLDYFHP